jgi:hypothetical protein
MARQNSSFFPSGNAQLDRQMQDLTESARRYSITAVITGSGGSISKAYRHGLNRKPSSWVIVNSVPATGVSGSPSRTAGGAWDINTVEFTFPGDGEWEIQLG